MGRLVGLRKWAGLIHSQGEGAYVQNGYISLKRILRRIKENACNRNEANLCIQTVLRAIQFRWNSSFDFTLRNAKGPVREKNNPNLSMKIQWKMSSNQNRMNAVKRFLSSAEKMKMSIEGIA